MNHKTELGSPDPALKCVWVLQGHPPHFCLVFNSRAGEFPEAGLHTLIGSQRGEVTSGLQSGALFPEEGWELELPVFVGGIFTMAVNHKYAKWDTIGYSRFPTSALLLNCLPSSSASSTQPGIGIFYRRGLQRLFYLLVTSGHLCQDCGSQAKAITGLHLSLGKLLCGSPRAPHTWFSLMSPSEVGALLATFPKAGVGQSILKRTPQTLWGSHSKGSLQNLQRLLSPHRFNRFRPPPQVHARGIFLPQTGCSLCLGIFAILSPCPEWPSLLFTWVVVTCFSEFSSNDSSQG